MLPNEIGNELGNIKGIIQKKDNSKGLLRMIGEFKLQVHHYLKLLLGSSALIQGIHPNYGILSFDFGQSFRTQNAVRFETEAPLKFDQHLLGRPAPEPVH